MSNFDSNTAPDVDVVSARVSRQVKELSPLLFALYVPTLLSLAVLVLVNLRTGIPIRYFTIDPLAEFNAPMYVGLVSNLGVLLWCSCAAICLFSGVAIGRESANRETCLFMVCSGLVTAMLLFDDLFMLHEEVFPDHLFIPQPLVFVAYGSITLAYLFRFRKTILATEYLLLLLAVGFFAASVFVDLFVTPEEFLIAGYPGRHLIEDGLKLFGIVTWTAYLIRVCAQAVRAELQSARNPGRPPAVWTSE